MAERGTTQGLALTPARWATWVAQRHEWNGYLWIRWSDAEAILLFVSGRPRIHLWGGAGWVRLLDKQVGLENYLSEQIKKEGS